MRLGDRTEETEVLLKRHDILERLCRSPAHVRDLVEEMDHSRSTINRALTELEELGFVERGDRGIEATTAGRLAADRLRTFFGELDDIFAAERVLDHLPSETLVSTEFVAGSEPILATGPAPYQPLERVHDALGAAEGYRALVPVISDSRYVRLLYEHVLTQGNPAELVVTPAVFETLREEFPRQTAVMAESDDFSVFVGSLPAFGLGLCESGSRGSEPATTAHVVVPNESGSVHGLLVNDSDDAVAWASEQFLRAREQGVDRTDELIVDTDGGVDTLDEETVTPFDQPLPVALEREGFVNVDRSYFRDEPVADPATAWRAGLSLAEVRTGYAIERTDDAVVDQPKETDLPSILLSMLTDGDDALVIGPPGSGKSTVCKQVACDWYDGGFGPVFYRESNRGQPLESVDDLVAAATATEGHVLVVVEDAVRPATSTIFETFDRFDAHDDVSVLLDARESEWREHVRRREESPSLDVRSVPPMTRASCERLVDHFERTSGTAVDIPTETLWEAIRDEDATGDSETYEMLRLIHRLATYADPLANEPTALEDAVAAVYEDVSTDDIALTVGILVNTLNAAGLGVDRELLYAANTVHDADDGGALSDVDAAIDRLEGRVLFAEKEGYRTVHEEWSVAFLAHLLEREGEETATRLFGDSVSSLLALADDTDTCQRITNHTGNHLALRAVLDDPASWADRIVRAIYLVGQQRPKLAPLFGDGSSDSIRLPDACSASVLENRPSWLGEAFLAGGYYDCAERAFERLSRDEAAEATERLLGLARISINRGAYDSAIDSCQECLALLEAQGLSDDVDMTRIRARLQFGEALFDRGAFDQARDHYQTALSECRAGEYRHLTAKTLHRLGRVALERGELAQAREFCESSLEIRQELSDWSGEAATLNHLGDIAWKQGRYDCAHERCERSLEISQLRGDRKGVARSLHSLGNVAAKETDYSRAADFYERSLERYRDIDDRDGESSTLHGLAEATRRQGELGRAVELYEQSLDIKREIGDKHGMALSLNNLGLIEGIRGNYDRAATFFDESLELDIEAGARDSEAKVFNNFGQIELRRGNFRRARELYDRSLAIKREIEEHSAVASSLNNLGTVATHLGNEERATEYFEQALETATRIEDPDQRARSLRGLGALALESGSLESAGEYIDRAVNSVGGDDQLLELRIRLTDARLALARGDTDLARATASELAGKLESVGANYWLARSKRLLGRIAAANGDIETAREHYLEAFDCFDSLDSAHDGLVTLEFLLELPSVGEGAEYEYTESARRLLSGAPAAVAERHEPQISALTGND